MTLKKIGLIFIVHNNIFFVDSFFIFIFIVIFRLKLTAEVHNKKMYTNS